MVASSAEGVRGVSRRSVLAGVMASVAVAPLLSACGGGGSGGKAGTLKFWDMIWGPAEYSQSAKSLVAAYKPSGEDLRASYQTIPWANFYQTFASAVASKTGPAVSTGSAFMPYQLAAQGAIAYADDVLAGMDVEDFLPGTVEALKTDKGYVGIPWLSEIRLLWYRKSLLEKAGAEVPMDWPSFLEAGRKLKKAGIIGYGTSAADTGWGDQSIHSFILNNGGGYFNADGAPDCVTDRNIEAVEFIQRLVSEGIVDPAVVSLTQDDMIAGWKNGKIAMGIGGAFWQSRVQLDDPDDLLLTDPLTGPHGDKGTLQYLAAVMMYTNTPSQASSEAFVKYYFENMKVFWEKKLIASLPVMRSIADLPEFAADTQAVKAVNDWVPIAKSFQSPAPQAFPALGAIDGTSVMHTFGQQVYQNKTSPKDILQSLQNKLETIVEKNS